ncbi:MAG: glycoside hydrolase family 3 protein [Lachnospiraceae bacterium]|nr:glycoside hydrolase family 3 protein [Lachnospiraceae bacterium]
MKRICTKLVALLGIVSLFGSSVFPQPVNAADVKGSKLGVVQTSGSIDEQVEKIIAGMTTEQKLAQMMIVTLRSGGKNTTVVNRSYEKILKKYDFGGMILFAGSIADTKQTVTLIRKCQSAAMKSEKGIPMFVCVDQEGGLVNRVSFGTTSSGNMGLAATGDTALTEESAVMLGKEIAAMGFNMDFAPVSDVNNNPNNPIIGTRSFSDDPKIVSDHVVAFIKGLSESNVSAALKHFPGHGNVGEDSHTGLPLSELTLEELKACELIPFQAGIDAGADMIMTAHIQYPNIEKNTYVSKKDGEKVYLPATLSRTIMTDVLRKEMGYDGIIITDAMDMGAITTHFDEIDAAVLAINAGVDILLCNVDIYKDDETNTLPAVKKYMKKLLERVKAGEIKEEELDDSVARILKLKIKNGIMENTLSVSKTKQIKKAEAVVGCSEHHAREWEIAQKGMTMLKNEGSMFPIDGNDQKKTLILVPSDYRRPAVEYAVSRLEKEGLADAKTITVINYSGLQADDKEVLKAAKDADRVLILSQSASKNELMSNVIEQVHKTKGHRVALLSLGLPYDVACYEDVDAVICAYNYSGSAHDAEGNGPFNLNVAVAVCSAFGQSVPQGKLPINIPKLLKVENGKNVYSDELLYKRGAGIGR